MKSAIRLLIITTSIIAVVNSFVTAQDLQELLNKLGKDAAVGYVTPILSGWAGDLNSGFYSTADLHDVLGFDVGVKVGLAIMKDDEKTFELNLPNSIKVNPSELGLTGYTAGEYIILNTSNYPAKIRSNTAVGEKAKTDIRTLGGNANIYAANGTLIGAIPIPENQLIYALPGGLDYPAVPLPMPQVAIGLPFGFEVIGRFIPTVSSGDAGKFNYWGFGLRYDIDQWIPLIPLDLAVHFATQKLTFKSKDNKDIFSANGTAFGIEASKSFAILTLYGGLQIEKSTMTLEDYTAYDLESGQSVTVPGFEVKGKNKSRFTAGLRVVLLFLNIHADYSFAKTPVATLGVGVTIR